MLEVRKAAAGTDPRRESMPHSVDSEESVGSMTTFREVIKAAISPKVLHSALEKRANNSAETSRYRVQNDCDEAGKRFISIEVLPRFL